MGDHLFYCKNTAPATENPLPGFRAERLPTDFEPPSKIIPEEHADAFPFLAKAKALLANGLIGVDLTRYWVSWRILPLSRRPGLMYEYSGESDDPQRYTKDNFTVEEVFKTVKTLLGESQESCNKVGLASFFKQNLAPPVSIFLHPAQHF
jgi:hypothetical protein